MSKQPVPEHFIVFTLNHKTISLKNLPDLSFDQEQMDDCLRTVVQDEAIAEIAGLCTCNRTEFFAAVHSVKDAAHTIVRELGKHTGYGIDAIRKGLRVLVDAEAVTHLFRLVSGLESMVVGDAQILGQVKQSYRHAKEMGMAGQIFHQVFQKAFTSAKKVCKETGLGQGRISVSALAVESAESFFGSLEGVTAAVIGAGKMGTLTARYLRDSGVKELRILNRSISKSEELANQVGGRVYAIDEMERIISECDLIVSATAAPDFLITKAMVQSSVGDSTSKKLLVDIALPSDIEESVSEVEGVSFLDLEALQEQSKINQESRLEEIKTATAIVNEELERLGPWPLPFHVDALANELGKNADMICQEEFAKLTESLPELTEEQLAVISAQMSRLANRIILKPRRNIRRFTEVRSCPSAKKCLADIFAQDCGLRENPLSMRG